jgi:hypothetical protein
VNEDEMDGPYSMHGRYENAIKILSVKYERRKPLERPECSGHLILQLILKII